MYHQIKAQTKTENKDQKHHIRTKTQIMTHMSCEQHYVCVAMNVLQVRQCDYAKICISIIPTFKQYHISPPSDRKSLTLLNKS